MRRKKGSFRNGRKQGARSNLHNFRSSGHGVKWNDRIAIEVAEKAEAKASIEKVVVEVEVLKAPAKKKGRPKKEK